MATMPACRQFEFEYIREVTDNFHEELVIGRGGFGKVYIARIVLDGSTSVVVAIKRLDTKSKSGQGAAEFSAELKILSEFRHCNIVSLIGFCNDGNEMILVYDYMSNRSVSDHLYKRNTPLSWLQRLNICIDACRGLHYLHTGKGNKYFVIHRDVKTSNILLHKTWTAKISDLGLSKLCPTSQSSEVSEVSEVYTQVKGSYGYLDPDYCITGTLTRKSDVYSFGVVLLEMLCRKCAFDGSKNWVLTRWAQEFINKGNEEQIVDSDIRGEIAPKCLKKFVRIINGCLQINPAERSSMEDVLARLENVLSLQEQYNNSLQPAIRTLLGKVVDMLPFFSSGENSVLSSDNKENNRWANNVIGSDNNTLPDTIKHLADHSISNIQKFEFKALRKSTDYFNPDKVIGIGSSGLTYLCWVNSSKYWFGADAAVKVLRYKQDHWQWKETVSFLGQLSHPNVIHLLGYSCNESQQYLIFEYMPNKSFDRFIFTDKPNHIAEPLSWSTRLMIMKGVARALVYLHSIDGRHYQRDLNAANILLDEDFHAKLGGFYFPKYSPSDWDFITHVINPRTMRAYGYACPLYVCTGDFTPKSEIYSFGVVLLETLTGLRVIDEKRPIGQQNLVDWALPFLGEREELKKIMDPCLQQNYPVEGAFDCASLVSRCLARFPENRPSSREVLQSLEQISSNSMTT